MGVKVVAAVAVALLAGCGGSPAGSGPITTTTATISTTVPQGTPVTNDGLTITVTNMWRQKAIGNHEARGTWVIVRLQAQNKSTGPKTFEGMWQTLIVGGKEYSPDSSASEDVDQETGTSVTLNPGFGDFIVVAFDIPDGAVEREGARLKVQRESDSPTQVFIQLTGAVGQPG
jgi:hypothetical protein